jgi:DNA-binding NarL/FixJ family response regulator
MTLRVVVAEDSLLVREGVRRVLETQPDLEVVALCASLPELLSAVAEHRPDVVVTDVRMPPTSTDEGIQAANALHESHPSIGVVVLSQYADPEYALSLLAAGSRGRSYLLKERVSDVDQLARAVRAAAAGGSVIDPKVVDTLFAARTAVKASRLRGLTPREREVLAEIAQGRSNAAVAAALRLTERAVEKHINALFGKLGLTDEPDINRRVRAVLLYLAEQTGTGTGATSAG